MKEKIEKRGVRKMKKQKHKLQNKIDKKIKENKKDIVLLLGLWLFSIAILWNFISGHYATDTYNIMYQGYYDYAINWSLNDGRVFNFLLGMLAGTLQIPIQGYVIGMTVAASFVSCIVVIVLKNMLVSIKKPENKLLQGLVLIISYVTVFNFMYLENLYFVESFSMALSLLCYVLATKILMNKGRNYTIKAAAFVMIGVFFYQGTIGFLALISFVFLGMKYKRQYKEMAKNLGLMIAFMAIAYLINRIQIELVGNLFSMEQNRLGGVSNVVGILKKIVMNFYYMIYYTLLYNSSGLFPQKLFLLFLSMIMIITTIDAIKKRKAYDAIMLFSMIGLTLVTTIAMCVVAITAYDTGRVHFPIGALSGCMGMYLYGKTEIFSKESAVRWGLILTIGVYTIITVSNYVYLTYQHKRVNELEEQLCQKVGDYITNYEQTHQIKVEKAKIFNERMVGKGYFREEIKNRSVLTYNAVYTNWSSVGAINYYTNRNLEKIFIDKKEEVEEYDFYIEEKERQGAFEDNFICVGDTVYYCVYI